MSENIRILRLSDRQEVPATLTRISQKNVDDFETFWKPRILAKNQGDEYWDWQYKSRTYLSRGNYEAYAIEYEKITQGMMLIETENHRSWFDPEVRLVYVATLETAPWNRFSFQPDPMLQRIGSNLLRFAKFRSQQLGYKGLVGLHSLPRAESFYEKLNMNNCGKDPDKDNLTYFEWYKSGERQ
ncbi:GNAT family N-acetyltransferase [Pseudanabaena galeata UHCC 0370]|uniref:GNAT family N-acetyltransferase n=1 Tax=Pseudanabaena galeata UHCC 0370 TaxID=3110310 RepID=A0ABU5TP59_9CYAN|nr:GNAT family N-acetyltransferase [Pseudanabaena galeata]MEA5480127.1 GNAT family N-acetyltransferase [Pseudanabaena galeata UHCC 0370]